MLFLLLLIASCLAIECRDGQLHTDRPNRKVYRCMNQKWHFTAMLLRKPSPAVPKQPHVSHKCHNNPGKMGPIAGFVCNEDYVTLECTNTHVSYICFKHRWHMYEIGK